MRKRSERVERYICNGMSSRYDFCLALCSFGPPSHSLVVITWRGVGCRYTIRLGYTVKRVQLLKINAQMSSISIKGCMLSDLARLPLLAGMEKVLLYYYLLKNNIDV